MHQRSLMMMERFFADLDPQQPLKILDVGSKSHDGGTTYKSLMRSAQWTYVGMDMEAGPNVDIISDQPYHWNFPDEHFDAVISGQCIEHTPDLHAWFAELGRVLKPGGMTCIIAPWKWEIHNFPRDYWRILPDGMEFLLQEKAGLEVISLFTADAQLGSVVTHAGVPLRDLTVHPVGQLKTDTAVGDLKLADDSPLGEFAADGDCVGIARKPLAS